MGGSKSPLNIFKLSRGDDPKEVLNWRLWFAVFSFGIMGTARGMLVPHNAQQDAQAVESFLTSYLFAGVDEGLISGTLASKDFRDLLNLPDVHSTEYASVKATIAAMVQIGSVAGAGL